MNKLYYAIELLSSIILTETARIVQIIILNN